MKQSPGHLGGLGTREERPGPLSNSSATVALVCALADGGRWGDAGQPQYVILSYTSLDAPTPASYPISAPPRVARLMRCPACVAEGKTSRRKWCACLRA